MGTTRTTVKKRSESAAETHKKQKTKPSQIKRTSNVPNGPIIKWTKPMCFALGLTVAHQHKERLNKTWCPDWEAVLLVINDIFLREFEDFKKDYPNGLPLGSKLRSQYSDHDRPRNNKWLKMHPKACTAEEIQEMIRMRDLVFEAEQRLSETIGSVVMRPGANAATWVQFTARAKQSPAQPVKSARKAARKPKVKNGSRLEPKQRDEEEYETSEKQADDDVGEDQQNSTQDADGDDTEEYNRSEEQVDKNTNEEQDNFEQQADSIDNDEQRNSNEQSGDDLNDGEECSSDKNPGGEESSNGSDDHSSDEDNVVVAHRSRRVVVVVEDEHEDAESASDDEVTEAADAIRAYRNKPRSARQAVLKTQPERQKSLLRKRSPQRKKSRLSKVLNADEFDEQPPASIRFRGVFETGTRPAVNRGIYDIHFDRSNPLEFEANDVWDKLGNGSFDSLQTVDNTDLVSPTLNNYVPNYVGGDILGDAIIQAKAAATVGTQDGLYLVPAKQTELLRRHEPRDASVERYNQVMSFKGLATSPYPALAQEHHHRNLDASRPHYGEGHAERSSYGVCKRTLIVAFQARHWINLWVELQRALGLDWNKWNIVKDLIDPIVLHTGMPRNYVSDAVTLAMDKRAVSSLKFAKLLGMPTKIDQSRGHPDGTLGNIIQQINAEPKLQMIHTNDVDFNTQPPTYTFRKNMNGSGNDFRFVHYSDSLYGQTGEVRRVMLTYGTTGQGKEVDLMLCDKPI